LVAGSAIGQSTGLTIYTKYLLGYPIPNASVYIDDNFVGTTDDNGALFLTQNPYGVHNITATHENYENATKEVDLSQETEVTIRMQDRAQVIPPGAMMIYARENTESRNLISGASIYVDEAFAGKTDNYGRFWTEKYTGEHQVRVSKEGSVDSNEKITFTPGGNYTFLLTREEKQYSIFNTGLFVYALGKEVTLGLVATLKLSIFAFTIGIIIGLIMGIGRVSSNRVVRYCASIYVEGVRGLPLVLQILFVYYGMPFFVSQTLGIPIIINEFYAATIALSMNSGAYMAEIFKAGIEAIHKGQMEAARSVGMSYWQAMRFIILPQAFKIVLPALGNEFIALIKDSSIALVISYQEITYWAKSVGYEYYNAFTPLVAAGCVYLIITIPLGKLVQYIEKRYSVTSPRKEGAGWLGRRKKIGGAGGIGGDRHGGTV
jgi:polar amino acid transport system permease protein